MYTYLIAGVSYSSELYHHGIRGQKWGHKNGPPYPLSSKAHSKSEQKAGWRSSLKNKRNLKGMEPEVASFVAECLATVGMIAFSVWANKMNTKRLEEKGRKCIEERQDLDEYVEERGDNISQKAATYFNERVESKGKIKDGLKMKDREFSIEDDMKAVNPEYGNYFKAVNNCALCSGTYDLRRRGYDVTAGFTQKNDGVRIANVVSWYKGAKCVDVAGNMALSAVSLRPSIGKIEAKNAIDKIANDKGSRGILGVMWGYYGGGHAVNYEVDKDGVFRVLDCQNNKIYSGDDAVNLLSCTSAISTIRTDNCEPDLEMMRKDGVFR